MFKFFFRLLIISNLYIEILIYHCLKRAFLRFSIKTHHYYLIIYSIF
jgi:hypothetical protein